MRGEPVLAQPKGEPRVVAKILKRRKKARMDVSEKELVRKRDKEACRVCQKRTRDVHERLFKSLGGFASLENSICACRKCHQFLQEHGIKVLGLCCNGKLTFQMNAAVARMIFGARALPKHCEIAP